MEKISQMECDDYFCQTDTFDHLAQCANCIVAHGGERPYDWNSSGFDMATATPQAMVDPGWPSNPEGFVDEDQASGWLRNVTQRCSDISRPLTSFIGPSGITATATTTYVRDNLI